MNICRESTLAALAALFVHSTAVAGGRCVPVHDATMYSGKTAAVGTLLKPVTVVYGMGEWWKTGEEHNPLPDSTLLQNWVVASNKRSNLTVIDIETWPTGDAATAESSIQRFGAVIDAVKRAGRKGQIGVYGTIPNRSYWSAVAGPGTTKYTQWQASNSLVAPLANHVDILFPSLYTFYKDAAGWRTYASENIKEARRVGAGKPVYVFLWPQLHIGEALDTPYLDSATWAAQLELASIQADGIVIWGGYKARWDENAEWWRATKTFIERNCGAGRPRSPTGLRVDPMDHLVATQLP